MHKLWDNLHDMFDTDDGSLPEIHLANLSGASIVNIWTYLRSSAYGVNAGASFWHEAKGEDIGIDDVPNAAEFVRRGEVDSFHVVLRGISIGGTTIPDLGVFVSPDAIYLDYRMGPEWRAAEVNSLFALLHHLQTMDQNAVITLPPRETADFRQRFAKAFAEYGKGAV